MSKLRQINTILQETFVGEQVMLAWIGDKLKDGVTQMSILKVDDGWEVSYNGTIIVKDPTPIKQRKRA